MKNERGFTLIELLVVIGIIGILSGIVLINVNSARNKAKDAAVKGAMEQVRLVAEIWYDNSSPSTYVGLAGFNDYAKIDANVAENSAGAANITLNPSASAYCAYAPLNDTTFVCVDSTGRSDTYAAAPVTCAGAGFTCQ